MSFRLASLLVCAVFVIGALGLFFAPNVTLAGWGIHPSDEARFVGRRLGASFVGFSILLFLARNAGPSEARRALAYGVAAAMGLVAMIGFGEYLRGFADANILTSVAIEAVCATLLGWTGRNTK